MKDVHAQAPDRPGLGLRRVGLAGLKKPLVVQRPGHVTTLTATFEVGVDLPADRKGSDLSRNAELLAEVVDRTATRPAESLERACSEIARELLAKHPYARQSVARAEAVYFLPRGVSEARRSLEDFHLIAEGRGERGPDDQILLSRSIAVEAVGMTACPCAMESCRDRLRAEFPSLNDPALEGVPIVTHNQRNTTRLTLDVPDGADVEADRMVEAVEEAQSSPTFAILKRGDEADVVLGAHRRPRFVEDVLRELLEIVASRFPQLPDSAGVSVTTRSEESIHKYDVVATHSSTLGSLRERTGA